MTALYHGKKKDVNETEVMNETEFTGIFIESSSIEFGHRNWAVERNHTLIL